ncbi:MAG: hypothetical protein V1897_04930 [Pseudomonadota bacterium]
MFPNHIGLVLTVREQGPLRRSLAQVAAAKATCRYRRNQLSHAGIATVQVTIHPIHISVVSNAAAKDLLSQADKLSVEPILSREFFHVAGMDGRSINVRCRKGSNGHGRPGKYRSS